MNTAAAKPQRATIAPRFIRAGDAPGYLGMCRAEFNKEVRPHLREFAIGKQGVGFCRYELDAFADDYIERKAIDKARPATQDDPRSERQGEEPWREKRSRASMKGQGSGISTKSSEVSDFRKALEQATGRKRSNT